MSQGIDQRFEAYCEVITEVLEHADRRVPAQWYLKGLILPGERKSVEPMAARVCPDHVQSAHQSMHHLVAAAGWSDRAVLAAAARQVAPELLKTGRQCWWILDDTSHVKKGRHSVGVARQYCGRLGKQDNCQVAVSLSLATVRGSLPLDYRLYLPREWTDDRARCSKAGVPESRLVTAAGSRFAARVLLPASRSSGRWRQALPEGSCWAMPGMARRRIFAIGSASTR